MTLLKGSYPVEVAVMRQRTFSSFDLRACTTNPKNMGNYQRNAPVDLDTLKEWTVAIVAPGLTSGCNPIVVMESFSSAKAALKRAGELVAQLNREGSRATTADKETSDSGLKPYLRRDYVAAVAEAAEEKDVQAQTELPPLPVPVRVKPAKSKKIERLVGSGLLDGLELDE